MALGERLLENIFDPEKRLEILISILKKQGLDSWRPQSSHYRDSHRPNPWTLGSQLYSEKETFTAFEEFTCNLVIGGNPLEIVVSKKSTREVIYPPDQRAQPRGESTKSASETYKLTVSSDGEIIEDFNGLPAQSKIESLHTHISKKLEKAGTQ